MTQEDGMIRIPHPPQDATVKRLRKGECLASVEQMVKLFCPVELLWYKSSFCDTKSQALVSMSSFCGTTQASVVHCVKLLWYRSSSCGTVSQASVVQVKLLWYKSSYCGTLCQAPVVQVKLLWYTMSSSCGTSQAPVVHNACRRPTGAINSLPAPSSAVRKVTTAIRTTVAARARCACGVAAWGGHVGECST